MEAGFILDRSRYWQDLTTIYVHTSYISFPYLFKCIVNNSESGWVDNRVCAPLKIEIF